nr:hypothetical protein [Tanacetum cinerariifolium]
LIRRIQWIRYDVLGFLGVGAMLDIFQNILLLYFQYDLLVFTGYGVLSLFPSWSLVTEDSFKRLWSIYTWVLQGKINPNMIRRRNDILEEDMPPRRRFSFTAPPPGCDIAENYVAAARAPRSQYNFVDTVEAGHGLIRSPGYDAQTIARAADRAEDVGYSAEDLAVTQMMRIHALEARARTDTVEDASSSCYLYFSFLAI